MREGWRYLRVEEFADVSLGKMLDRAKNRGTPMPYLRNVNVRWFGFDLSDVLDMRFDDDEIERYTARSGDLMVCEGGYPGRAAIWSGEPIYFQKAVHRVRCGEPRRARWLLYFLLMSDLDGSLKKHFTGTGIQHFTAQSFRKVRVPVPPLPEQQRIVAILDEAFAAIAVAVANAKKNLANARELCGRTEAAIFSADEGWETVKLGHVAEFRNGLNYTKLSNGEQIRVVGVGDFGQRFWVPADLSAARINGTLSQEDELRTGDILTVRSNGNRQLIGRSILAGSVTGRIGHSGFVIRTRLRLVGLIPEFLCHYLRRPLTRAKLIDGGSGTNISSLSQGTLAGLDISYPSPGEQERIISRLGIMHHALDDLDITYTRKLTLLAELRQSLLARAFSGELTAADALAA